MLSNKSAINFIFYCMKFYLQNEQNLFFCYFEFNYLQFTKKKKKFFQLLIQVSWKNLQLNSFWIKFHVVVFLKIKRY